MVIVSGTIIANMPKKKLSYDISRFKFAVVATDVVILTIIEQQIHVLLIQLMTEPYQGMWAVPGGMVKPDETVDQAALRHLKEKAGVSDVFLEQLYTFSEIDRDPRGRVISTAYFALVPHQAAQPQTTDRYAAIEWWPVQSLPELAYDHQLIIKTAIERLQSKIAYTNIAYSLLPRLFTLTELQEVYQIVLGQELDKRNFRKKILSLGIIKKTDQQRKGEPNRPAQLFTFCSRKPQNINIL